MADTGVSITVRLSQDDLGQLQIASQIKETSIGNEIREAVKKHLASLAENDEFKRAAEEFLRKNQEILDGLMKHQCPDCL